MHSVIQTVDCLISLSVLWKALANKQDLVEKLHYIDTKVEVVMMIKLQGTWVLAVAKAVLDVALSVAASVILSLLGRAQGNKYRWPATARWLLLGGSGGMLAQKKTRDFS